MPKMILIMTGKNIHEAVKPTENAQGQYYFYTPRHPQTLAFEAAVQSDAMAHNILLPSRFYFARVENDLIIDHFSAKMIVAECFAAILDIVHSTSLTNEEQSEIDRITVANTELWNQSADKDGVIYDRSVFGPLKKASKNCREQFWLTVYNDRIAVMNLWEDWA